MEPRVSGNIQKLFSKSFHLESSVTKWAGEGGGHEPASSSFSFLHWYGGCRRCRRRHLIIFRWLLMRPCAWSSRLMDLMDCLWNLAQAFVFPRGWILVTLKATVGLMVVVWIRRSQLAIWLIAVTFGLYIPMFMFPRPFPKSHHEINGCGFNLNISTAIWWIAMTFGSYVHVLKRMNPEDFIHHLTLP